MKSAHKGVPRALDTALSDKVMAWAKPKSASLTSVKSSERRILPGVMSLGAV